MFDENNKQKIYFSALEVLERTGVAVRNEEARKLLEEAGSKVQDQVVHVPSWLVEKAIQTAPRQVTVYSRDGTPAMRLTNGNSYFGTGENTIYIVDTDTGERRKWLLKDIQDSAQVQDQLPNIDYVMPCGLASDCRPDLSPLYHFQTMSECTKKPIICSAYDGRGAHDLIEMANIISDSIEMSIAPFMIHFVSGHAPLIHAEVALTNMLINIDEGIPVIYGSSEVAGSSAPMTLAGTLVLNIATGLSALTIAQLRKPGSALIMPGWATNANMRSMTGLFGSPEFTLLICSAVEVFHFLGLPTFGTAGCSDALVADEQAAIESCMSCVTQALVGANVIHDIGFLESGLTGSLDLIVMTDELLGGVKRFKEGIALDDESLALDVINKVGPAGNYLMEDHTLKHMRSETWEPSFYNRDSYKDWFENGGRDLATKAKERVNKLRSASVEAKLDNRQVAELSKFIKSRESGKN
jgi:trimethylamine--corrinoid protein Co-methyltransferase